MEPISAIALSLALGAGAIASEEVVKNLVKDAYDKLKGLIKGRYPKVSVEQLEQAPESKSRRAVVEEDLTASGAGQDAELLAAAHRLTELIRQQAPGVAATIGVDLRDVEAANLRLADIAASGTGVKVEKGKFSGDIDIRGVRAGVPPKGCRHVEHRRRSARRQGRTRPEHLRCHGRLHRRASPSSGLTCG